MQLKLLDKKAGKVELADTVFSEKFNEPLVHQIVTAYMAAGRSGNHAQKTRAEVRGGGKKPWKQKGTGRARAGTIRSPIWRKGGVVFAAKPRDYSQKVNKKMYRAAMRSMLSELIRQERLHLMEKFDLAQPKTKSLVQQLNELKLDNVLIILDQENQNIELAARNLPHVEVILARHIDPVSIIKYDHVLATAAAIKQVEEQLV